MLYIVTNKQYATSKITSYIFPLHNRKYVLLEIDCKIYFSISFMEQSIVIYLAVGYIIIIVMLIFHDISCTKLAIAISKVKNNKL